MNKHPQIVTNYFQLLRDNNASLIEACNRGEVIEEKCVFLLANKYGVIGYDLPTSIRINCLAYSTNYLTGSIVELINKKLGVITDGWDRQDRLHNYQACQAA